MKFEWDNYRFGDMIPAIDPEEYQVMCEARVFSRCLNCKKDWDNCKCTEEQIDAAISNHKEDT